MDGLLITFSKLKSHTWD